MSRRPSRCRSSAAWVRGTLNGLGAVGDLGERAVRPGAQVAVRPAGVQPALGRAAGRADVAGRGPGQPAAAASRVICARALLSEAVVSPVALDDEVAGPVGAVDRPQLAEDVLRVVEEVAVDRHLARRRVRRRGSAPTAARSGASGPRRGGGTPAGRSPRRCRRRAAVTRTAAGPRRPGRPARRSRAAPPGSGCPWCTGRSAQRPARRGGSGAGSLRMKWLWIECPAGVVTGSVSRAPRLAERHVPDHQVERSPRAPVYRRTTRARSARSGYKRGGDRRP